MSYQRRTVLAGLAAVISGWSPYASAAPRAARRTGFDHFQLDVSLSGYEAGKGTRDERIGKDYRIPDRSTWTYFSKKGFDRIRFPMKWERLQPEVKGELDHQQLGVLEKVISEAAASGITLIADLHNYGSFRSAKIGDPVLPLDALADFWLRFASHFAGHFEAYGLMNEPHGLRTREAWSRAAQLAVKAIREVDQRTTILCSGNEWSGAAKWSQYNRALEITDPCGALVYEAHLYFTPDNSGRYRQSASDARVDPLFGVRRLKAFTGWLKERGAQGYIGECGWPGADPGWAFVAANVLAACRDEGLGLCYWLAGEWSRHDPKSIQPQYPGAADRPSMKTLLLIGSGERPVSGAEFLK